MQFNDYFEEKKHIDGQVSVRELIAEATRTDLKISDKDQKMNYLEMCKSVLTSELYTCYQFMKDHGMLEEYIYYRDGEYPEEELPFKVEEHK